MPSDQSTHLPPQNRAAPDGGDDGGRERNEDGSRANVAGEVTLDNEIQAAVQAARRLYGGAAMVSLEIQAGADGAVVHLWSVGRRRFDTVSVDVFGVGSTREQAVRQASGTRSHT